MVSIGTTWAERRPGLASGWITYIDGWENGAFCELIGDDDGNKGENVNGESSGTAEVVDGVIPELIHFKPC
jgi:hypothetical protein